MPECYRTRLESLGFRVANLPYRGDWYHAKRLGEDFAVHLLTGRVQGPWGTGNEWTWEEAMSEYGGVERPAGTPPAIGFFRECQERGFELEPDHGSVSENRWAWRDGERYLLLPWTRAIMGLGFRNFALDDFAFVIDTLPELPQPAPVEGRPFVSMKDQPVTVTGRRNQQALFG